VGWMKRIFLFLAVNFLVIITISLILNVLGIRPYITAYGINYNSLMAFCLIWGMGGALFSLASSRLMAKWIMGVKIIDPDTGNSNLQELVNTVYRLSQAANLPKMPQVGIYKSPEVNAFATGPTKARSLVAVSSGLMERMHRDEIAGVLGHEITHITNGDMVTMTLIQGIVNAFVMFLSRAIAFAIVQAMRARDERDEGGFSYGTYFIVSLVLEILFMIVGSIVVAWFSRYREFRADAGGAKLAGRNNMVNALKALLRTSEIIDPAANQPAVQTLKISGRGTGLMRLFATHPPLEERIARLQAME
jgi:heat shock protein HtpX